MNYAITIKKLKFRWPKKKKHILKCSEFKVKAGEKVFIQGERGSGNVCLNGPAARRVAVGDIIIIIAYAQMDFEKAKNFKPTIVFPDTSTNKLK